jgi:hypothetical protein
MGTATNYTQQHYLKLFLIIIQHIGQCYGK